MPDKATDREVLQRIMQLLGPDVPPGTEPGLAFKIEEALTIMKAQGIVWRSRSIERRIAVQKAVTLSGEPL
jgi:hypothetical protein